MGARLVRDLNPAGASSPESIISIDGLLFFTADLGAEATDPGIGQGLALLKSDGTAEGTKVLKEYQSINDLVEVGGELYFIADDGTGPDATGGNRLWRSDGTARGTVLVKDLYPGADPNFPQDLFEIDGVLFYSAIDGNRDDLQGGVEGGIGKYPYVNGYEVWRREGDGVGSRFFRNLIPDKVITNFEASEDIFFPVTDDNGNQIELVTTTTTTTTVDAENLITTEVVETTSQRYENNEIISTTTTNQTQRETTRGDLETFDFSETITYDSEGNVDEIDRTEITTSVDIDNWITTVRTVQTINGQTVLEEQIQRATVPGDLETTNTEQESTLLTSPGLTVSVETYENDSFPQNFTSIQGNLFFTAHSSSLYSVETAQEPSLVGGLELWFSDGTESGTRPININTQDYTIRDPYDGVYSLEVINDPDFGFTTTSASSFPRELTKFGDQLVLVANDGISGFELWTVSAEGDNVRQISNLAEGNTSSSPEELTVVGDRLYFTANDGTGRKLWSTTQALGVPTLVNGAGMEPQDLQAVDGQLYFSARSELGRELWVADGNDAKLLEDINPGSGSSFPKDFTSINHWIDQRIETHLYFSADDGDRGAELWSLNLSSNDASPQRQADINSGPYSSEPRQLTNADEHLYFTADDGKHGRELWTLGVSILDPNGQTGPDPTNIRSEENQTYIYQFESEDNVSWSLNGGKDENLFELQADGSLSFKTAPIYDNPSDHNRDNTYEVVIRATDTVNGIATDQKINVEVFYVINIGGDSDGNGGGNGGSGGRYADLVVEEKQKDVYTFDASESVDWSLDGDDSEFFTIKSNGQLRFTTAPLYDAPADSDADNIYEITVTATNPTSGSSDKQDISVEVAYVVEIQGPSGEPGADQSSIQIEERSQDVFNFASEKTASWELAGGEDQSLFKIKSNGDLKFKQPPYYENPLDSGKDNIYEVIVGARNPEKGNLSTQIVEIEIVESYKSDFSLIKNIYPGSIGSNPADLVAFNNSILFSANDGKKGTELWQSQGSKTTTSRLKDINKGSGSSNPTGFTTHKNQAYFTADDGNNGQELWVTNGNKKGTELLADINAGAASSSPSDLLWFNQNLFFAADDGLHGRELWNYDPSSKSAKLVDNIQKNQPGSSSNPTSLTAFNGNIYFAATGDIYGRELWRTNGGLNQSYRISDINPGGFNSNPEDLVILGSHLYFTANTPYGDRAIYKTNGAPNDFTELSISIPEDLTIESVNLTFNTPELLKESGGNIFYSASTTQVVRRLITTTMQNEDEDGNKTTIETQEMKEENILFGRELWLTDSSNNGMKFVMDINPGQPSSSPNDFASINGLLYFSADDGIHGRELWASDGTEEGTSLVADINEGAKDSSPRSITEIKGEIYFSAKTNKHGRELWRLDEDSQGATRIVTAGKGKKKHKAWDDSKDEFRFELSGQFGKTKADRITGFSPDDGDQLALSANAFPGLSVINLVTVTSKRQLNAQKTQPSNLVYFEPKGKLYFDQNGSDPGYGDDGGLFAILKGGPDLAESAFRIV